MPGTFSSLDAMLADIRKCAKEAIENTHEEALPIIEGELAAFYASGQPKVYERTGALGNSGRVDGVVSGGDVTSFDAYLETNGVHPKPCKLVTMGDVIEATHNEPTQWKIVGNHKYWDEATEKIGEVQSEQLSKYFTKC